MLQDVVQPKKRNCEVQRQARGGSHEPEGAGADCRHDAAAGVGEARADRDAANLQTAEALDDRALQHVLRDSLRLVDQQAREQNARHDQQDGAQQGHDERGEGGRHTVPHQPVVHRREQNGEDRNTDDPCGVRTQGPQQRRAQRKDDERGALMFAIEERHAASGRAPLAGLDSASCRPR